MSRKDYRIGRSPSSRKTDAKNAIREALADGGKDFTTLLNLTYLSRPSLSSNLKELYINGEIRIDIDPKNFRKKIYSLTELGRNKLREFKVLKSFQSRRPLSPKDTKIANLGVLDYLVSIKFFIEKLIKGFSSVALAPSERENLAKKLRKNDDEIIKALEGSATLQVFLYDPVEDESVRQCLMKLKELTESTELNKYINIEFLRKFPCLGFVFEFDKGKFISKYLRRLFPHFYKKLNENQKESFLQLMGTLEPFMVATCPVCSLQGKLQFIDDKWVILHDNSFCHVTKEQARAIIEKILLY